MTNDTPADSPASTPADRAAQPRRARVPAEVARKRVLDVAISHVLRDGLTVGFKHFPLEAYRAEAGVTRSSIYREWSSHELFVADLIGAIFDRPEFSQGFSPGARDSATEGLAANVHLLPSAEGRRALFLELLRVGAERNFRDAIASKEWRSYSVLYAASQSPADPLAAEAMRAAATKVERNFIATMSGFYSGILGTLRMRPIAGATFETVATATHMVVSGFASRIAVDPSFAELTVDGPGLDGQPAKWHFVAYLTMQAVDALVEPIDDGETGK